MVGIIQQFEIIPPLKNGSFRKMRRRCICCNHYFTSVNTGRTNCDNCRDYKKKIGKFK